MSFSTVLQDKGAFAVEFWGCFDQIWVVFFLTVSRSRLPEDNHVFAGDFSEIGI